MRKRYSLELQQQVINEYKNGITVLELSNKYDITQMTIYRWLRNNNTKISCTRSNKYKILSLDMINKIKDLYINQKLSVYNIGKKLNMQVCSITNVLTKQGIYNPKKVIRYSQEFKQQIINEYINTDISVTKLVKKYNIGYTTLHYWLANDEQAKIKFNELINLKQQIVNEYNNTDYTVSELAKKYNLNVVTVRKWILKANNIPTLGIINRYPKEFIQQIINEYINNDISINQLAKQHNIGYTTVFSWLKKHNIQIKQSHKKNINDEDIIQAYENGLSISQINRKFHVSNRYIIDIINSIN